MNFDLSAACATIPAADPSAAEAARTRHAGLAKPAGSLGVIEEIGIRLSGSGAQCPPRVPLQPTLLVAAGDHGVHVEAVSPWPQAITAIMAGVIADGRAASSVMAAGLGVDVIVLDVGCATPVTGHPSLRDVRVVDGTRNLRVEDAMTAEEALRCIEVGHDAAVDAIDAGADCILLGDMGIANTTVSSCLVAVMTGADAAAVVGRGTGIDDATLAAKTKVIEDALARLGGARDPLGVLAGVGGAEHACLVGVILAAAGRRIPVILDGVITNAAALVAVALAPAVVDHCIAGHRSVEPAASLAIEHLGLVPLVDLDLRLGEGTGALLALPMVQAAARVLTNMASLADLGFG